MWWNLIVQILSKVVTAIKMLTLINPSNCCEVMLSNKTRYTEMWVHHGRWLWVVSLIRKLVCRNCYALLNYSKYPNLWIHFKITSDWSFNMFSTLITYFNRRDNYMIIVNDNIEVLWYTEIFLFFLRNLWN